VGDLNRTPRRVANGLSTRARFMVDTLTSLKSGKSKSANPDQGGEAAVRMKRFLGGLGRKRRRERELGAWRAARC
jgi:hypothetical protein